MHPPSDTIRQLWDRIQTSLWFVPAVMVAVSAGLAALMLVIDHASSPDLADTVPVLFSGRPDGARSVLATIATSTIGVAGVVFSMTIVSLQLASSQFGPRLLRTFLRDRGNQVVLGTFLGTFTFCVVVLPTIDATDDAVFVPHLSVTLAVLLAMISLGMLVYYIDHVAQSIHADAVVEAVGREMTEVIDELFPEDVGQAASLDDHEPTSDPATFQSEIQATAAGYVRFINADRLLALASETDSRIKVTALPGSFVIKGTPLAQLSFGSTIDRHVERRAADAFVLGTHRTALQDVLFTFEQAAEVAMRAMSPGINDPTTALHCIDRIGAGLAQLVAREVPSPWREDGRGEPRLHIAPVTLEAVLNATVIPISRTAGVHVQVWTRLLGILEAAADRALRDEDVNHLIECGRRISEHGVAQLACAADEAELREAGKWCT